MNPTRWNIEPSADSNTPPPLTSGDVLEPGLVVADHVHRSKDADVYRVWSTRHRAHAIAKVLRPDRAERPGPRRRLAHELRLLERLAHPSIVRTLGGDADRPLLLLEELRGRSLRAEFAASGDATWLRVCDVGIQLSAALHYLHEGNLIHADIKPANAYACDDGRVVLLDFSLAREPGAAAKGIGTRQFVSPEQARGHVLGPPTDIWGVGVILFRAATGSLPFSGEGHPQLEARAPSVAGSRGISSRVVRAIDACLAPDASDRPAAASLHEQLVAARDRIEKRLTRPLK